MVNQREFCRSLYAAAVEGVVEAETASLESPPGRTPPSDLVELSEWYRGLADADRRLARRLLREGATAAVFGVLAVVDGVRPIRNGQGNLVEFELAAQDGERVVLNDARAEMLHDVFSEMVQQDG